MTDPNSVPPTEPNQQPQQPAGNTHSGMKADPQALTGAVSAPDPIETKTHVKGSDLVRDFSHLTGESSRRYYYWIGLMPDAPVEAIVLGGQSWPKINKVRRPNPDRSGDEVFMPVIGAITRLDARGVQAIVDRLPWTVVRLRNDPGQQEEPGTGKNIGDVARQPSRGQIITVKTPEAMAELRRLNRPAPEYVEGPNDHPAARYLFAVLCPDQNNPARGEYYPDALEVTGLRFPDELPNPDPKPEPAAAK